MSRSGYDGEAIDLESRIEERRHEALLLFDREFTLLSPRTEVEDVHKLRLAIVGLGGLAQEAEKQRAQLLAAHDNAFLVANKMSAERDRLQERIDRAEIGPGACDLCGDPAVESHIYHADGARLDFCAAHPLAPPKALCGPDDIHARFDRLADAIRHLVAERDRLRDAGGDR